MNLLLIAQHSSLLMLILGLVGSLAVGMALHPNDEGDDDGDEKAAKEFREKAEKVKTGDDHDEEEVVEVKEDDEEDDEKDSRTEKRRARYRENQERATRAEQERDAERSRVSQLEQQNQLFQAQLTDVLSRVNQGTRVDPAVAELKQIEVNQESVLAEYRAREKAGTLTPEDEKALRQRMRELNAAEVKVQARGAVQEHMAQSGQVQGRSTQDEVIHATFASKYPDIMADARARQLVQAEERALLVLGKPRGWATIDEAVRITRKRLGMGSDVSETVRRRFTGTPSAGGGGGGDGSTSKVPLTKMDKKMMRARWPGLPEAKQMKLIAREKLAAQRASRGKE